MELPLSLIPILWASEAWFPFYNEMENWGRKALPKVTVKILTEPIINTTTPDS